MKKIGLLPGTFDPPTLGHLDIINRAAHICDILYVAVAVNSNKVETVFTAKERIHLLKRLTKSIPHAQIVSFDGLVIDFAKKHKADYLIRGLRAFSDFEYEFRMALANRKLGNMETVFLMSHAELAHISSSLIREIAVYGKRLLDFIPVEIEPIVFEKFQEKFSSLNRSEKRF